ncbi:hypothetical protein [Paludibacterium sp.]|uniref:hypothetical protein n=2 Tax=Paludibacterium sp. TaxID=1917523 RepID=UPI0025E03985|nr:hypothetical protein [Paludibacterium sp.]MBV8645848.1 hypothetical protein [Paludibacterium sp.]
MHDIDDPAGQSQAGQWTWGDFQIAWFGQAVPMGWQVACDLRLGAAAAQRQLDSLSPRQRFELCDHDLMAWGELDLHANEAGDALDLDITCHYGTAEERTLCLCAWQICDPCSGIAPVSGSKTLGDDGLTIDWTIEGAAQAGLAARLVLHAADNGPGETVMLSPLEPLWQGECRGADGHAAVTLQMRVSAQGEAWIDVRLRHARQPGETVRLARFPCTPVTPPDTVPTPGQGVVFSRPREFASFAYPRAILPPTPGQWARRFASVDNDTDFQNALRALSGPTRRQAMQAEALDFVSVDSKKYPGQFVQRIGKLSGPMGRLTGSATRAFLALRPPDLAALQTALQALLGLSAADFLSLPDYAAQLAQLQNSLVADLIAAPEQYEHAGALIRALRVCHTAELAVRAAPRLDSPAHLREPLQTSVLLPPALMVPPADNTAEPQGYARPLGLAEVQVIKQCLVRYRLGAIAHIENVMRGESKERSAETSRRIEQQALETHRDSDSASRARHDHGQARQAQDNQTNPLNALKREFDNLKQAYGADGLSVTVTGDWTDTPSGPATLAQNAAAHARDLLSQAAARTDHQMETARKRRSVEEFVERTRRRFDNETGAANLVGIYRWVDEIHAATLEPRGSRLIVEIVLADPARDYVRRNNTLHGCDARAPIPPWQGGDGIAPVQSALDINRNNYAALAARYNAPIVAPPPLTLSMSASLTSTPPSPQAELAIAPGYTVNGGTIGYGWTDQAGGTAALDILIGGTVIKIDPAADANPGTKPLPALPPGTTGVPAAVVAAGLEYVVNITLTGVCSDDSTLYRQWQHTAYNGIISAYRAQRDAYLEIMSALAEGLSRAPSERQRETLLAALQQAAIACLAEQCMAQLPPISPAWRQDAALLALAPLLSEALAWDEATYNFYARFFGSDDTERPDTLTLRQTLCDAPGMTAFLEAGCARLLVPVKPPHTLPWLFYLASQGQFWRGAPEDCPVSEDDGWLVNAIKSAQHESATPRPVESWEVEIATPMLILQAGDSLPDPETPR